MELPWAQGCLAGKEVGQWQQQLREVTELMLPQPRPSSIPVSDQPADSDKSPSVFPLRRLGPKQGATAPQVRTK